MTNGYTFHVYIIFQYGMKATAESVAAADGEAATLMLSPITFKAPGTYEFNLAEVNNKLGGVEYDATSWKVVAEVTSDGAGNMQIAWAAYDADGKEVTELAFENTYKTKAMSVIFGGTKVMDGRASKDGEFSFKLADADGKEVETVKNDAEGSLVFKPIALTKEGTFEYTLSEVLPEDDDTFTDGVQKDNVTYDTTTYTIKVEVTDDLKGNLKIAKLTYNDEAKLPVFTNEYVEPKVLEKTGDSTPFLPLTGIALGAVAVSVNRSASYKYLQKWSSDE